MANIDFLKEVDIFKNLKDDQFSTMQICWDEKHYQKRDKIFSEGEEAKHIWVVAEGQVGLRFDLPGHPTSEENTVSINSKGMCFGWSAFVPPNVYSLAAYCDSSTCKIIQLEKNCLIRLFEKEPATGYVIMSNIAQIIGNRFHQLQDEVVKRKGYEIMFQW